MEFVILLFALLIHCSNTVIAENDDDNATLSTVIVSLSPSTEYYHKIERERLQITCSANCDPPCQYQWYHQNFQINASVLNVNITKEMDYDAYGPFLCLASNEESGPFSSPEIRIYVKTGVLDIPSWTDIEEGETFTTCLLENSNDCHGDCYLYDPSGQRYYGYYSNCHTIRMERYLSGRWYWRWYYRGYHYFYFTVNIFITPSSHVLLPNERNITVNSSNTSALGPIRFVGRCNPPCTYVWYKDNNTFSFGNTLYITNADTSDSGYYECRVYNGTEMIDATSVHVYVYEFNGDNKRISENNSGECSERPSLEEYRNQNFTTDVSFSSTQFREVRIGHSLSLKCTAVCKPACTHFRWYYPGGTIDGQYLHTNVDESYDYNTGNNIFCVAWNNCFTSHASSNIYINVTDVPQNVNLTPDGDVNIIGGSAITFSVSADCNPPCKYRLTYRKDFRQYYIYKENFQTNVLKGGEGVWNWRIENRYRVIDRPFKVFVWEPHQLIPNGLFYTIDTTKCTANNIGPIRFIGLCNPNCTYIWYKNGVPFSLGNTLLLNNVNRNDSGEYYCVGFNQQYNVTSHSITVNLTGEIPIGDGEQFALTHCNSTITTPVTRHTSSDIERTCSSYLSNRAEGKASNYSIYTSHDSFKLVTIEEGARFSSKCFADCYPACQWYRWYYPGGMTDTQTLTLYNVNSSLRYDVGNEVYCVAWNDCQWPHSSRGIELNVEYGPKNITLTQNGNVNAEIGSSIVLTVNADCNPSCSYRLHDGSSWVHYNDKYHTTVSKASEGVWEWYIHNSHNSLNQRFNVYVWEPHQLIPSDLFYSIDTTNCAANNIGPIRFIGLCNPNCTYIWYKNGVPFSLGNTLLLNNVNRNDSGEFYCVGFNQNYNVTSHSIMVNFTAEDDRSYREYRVNEGDQFGPFHCTSSTNSSVKWKTPSGTVYTNTLHIASVTSDDYGDYICIRSDDRGDTCNFISLIKKSAITLQETCNAYLIDNGKGLPVNYSIRASHNIFKQRKLREGSSFTSYCHADCYPECKWYRWYYPGGTSDGQTLQLNDVNISLRYDIGGQVYCLAWNECQWPQSTRGIELNVGYGPKNIIYNATSSSYTVVEGESFGPFICTADCFEECTVYWSGSYHFNGNILYISNVVRSIEDYSWNCHLENSFGKYYTNSFRIDVKHGPKNPALIPGNKLTFDFRGNENPVFPLFRCTAECDPTCTYIWYKNKKFYSNANVLKIQNVGPQDHGKYHCYAFNAHGNYTFQTVDIIMFDNPTYIIYEPSKDSYELKIGDHLGPINCSADCNPECEYYWSTPTGPIMDRVLNITITSPIQGGEYVCHPWNVNYDWSSDPIHVDTDPCSESNYSPLRDYEKRSQGTKITSAPLCDQQLEENWYRAGFTDIPTEPPSMFSCGTTYPIWINASVPNERKILEIQACARGLYSDCEYSFQVSVKNCGDFRVYRLKPPEICPSAYCLDVNDATPPTGEIESASTSFSHIQWFKTHPRAGRFKRKPILWFKCEFTPVDDSEMYYSINWYVDQEPVIVDQTVAPNDPPVGYMSGEELKGFSAQINCAVGAKKQRNGQVGKMTNAATFTAGLQVTTSNTNILRGQSSSISLEQTVPFACDENVIEGRQESIANPSDCQINLELHGERTLTVCGHCTKITGFSGEDDYTRRNRTWTRTHSVTVCHKDDGSIDKTDTDFTIYFLTNRVYAENVWNNAKSPSTKVTVQEPIEKEWQSRYCYDLLDPHLRTFDGSYYQSHENGKYLLYRNNKTMQEVHVIHRPCYGSVFDPYCVCGVAARAGKDVFVINICDRNNLMEYTLCEDGALSVTKTSERYYNIYFPSGTSVSISIRTSRRPYWINLNIYPSLTDQFSVDGLCSSLDGKADNDFNPRYPSTNAYPGFFTDSWRLNSDEDLFNKNSYYRLNSLSTKKFCTCGSIDEEKCNFENQQITSKYSERKITCTSYSNGLTRRKKRSVSSRLLSISQADSLYRNNLERQKRSSGSNNNSITEKMSEDEARSYCEQTMNFSTAYSECLSSITVLDQSHIDSCTEDLKMSGDTNLTNVALESFLETCTTYTFKNNTIREENINFTRTILNLCPNGCSGNGDCNEGNCTCNENFAGADCSFNLHDPPEIDSITNNGTCDFTEDDCNEINLYGEFFMDDGNSTCKHIETKVFGDGTRLNVGNWTSTGSARTLFEGICTFEYRKINLGKDYVTEISVAYSNNGQLYSEWQTHILHDSACQAYNSTDSSVEMKDGYCFIDGRCALNGTSDKVRGNCFICDTDTDKFNWTFVDDFCFINNKCILNGTEGDDYPCHICDISDKSISTWSLNRGHCVINDTCYRDGDTKDGSDCKYCDSSLSISSWSINNSFCFINNKCIADGASQPSFQCHICDINANNTQWSINMEHCLIDGQCILSGEVQPNKTCNVCNNSTRHIWSVTPAFCRINNTCFVNYQENPEDPSSFCNASILTNQKWSYNDSFSQEPDTTGVPTPTTDTPFPITQEPDTTGVPTPTTDTPFPITPAVFDTHISLNKSFDPQLSDRNSTAYSKFKTEIESEVDNLYRSSDFKDVFDRNELYSVRNGSTKCYFNIYVNATQFQRENETVYLDGNYVADAAVQKIQEALKLPDSDPNKPKLLVQADIGTISSSQIPDTTKQMMTTEVEKISTQDITTQEETTESKTTLDTTTQEIDTVETTTEGTTTQKTTTQETTTKESSQEITTTGAYSQKTSTQEISTQEASSEGITTLNTPTEETPTKETTSDDTSMQETTTKEPTDQMTTPDDSLLPDNNGISELFTDKALYIGAAAGIVILIVPIIVIVIVVKLRNSAKMKRQNSASNKTGDSGSFGSNDSTYEDADSMKGFMKNPYMSGQSYRIPRASLSTPSKRGPYNYVY